VPRIVLYFGHMRKGLTLIELLIAIGIVAILTAVVAVALVPARRKARDTARIADMNQMGRFLLAISCYAPSSGAGEYDLQELYADLAAANPQITRYLSRAPRDPKSGSETASGYRYAYAADGSCALYANLEDAGREITLPALTAPTPGGGTGTLRASMPGPNGTALWYQIGR